MPRASFTFSDLELQRTASGEAEAAILIADGKVHLAATPSLAFDFLVAGAEYLGDRLERGSARAAASIQFTAYGRHAISGDRTSRGPNPTMLNSSDTLKAVREVLGEDAAEKVRLHMVARLLGRDKVGA